MGHWIEAVTLGVVQGLTEFLPISSSAHLDIVPKLIGWHKPGAQFTAVTQLGTMIAVMVYFRKDIIDTIGGMFKSLSKGGDKMSSQARLFYAVIIGTIPIGVIGLLLKKFIEKDLHNLYINATMLVVMGLLMGLAERMTNPRRDGKDIQIKDGIIVGLFQAIALIPGASRSGSTLTGAFFTGLDREAAVRFSFLLSLPAILLSGLVELKDLVGKKEQVYGADADINWSMPEVAVATVIAGLVGYACIAWLLRYLSKASTAGFVLYRIALAAVIFFLLNQRILTP
ncbi:MAG: undecaprenyl-diphosphate phosphatase [Armatimonadaceae bacterium]